jgi:hypothetical protein
MSYYEAKGAVKKALLELDKVRVARRSEALALSKEIGAKGYLCCESVFRPYIAGFLFESEPDPKVYRKDKRGDGWIPRNTSKIGKALRARMDAIHLVGGPDVAKTIGMKVFSKGGWRVPGIQDIGGRLILIVPDDVVPTGCKRITDVAFEKLTAKPKRARKAAKK